jgi:hypothetical protein
MSGGRIEIVVTFFDIFAMVPLRSRQPIQAFLEDRVVGVPKGERETQSTFAVTNPQQSVFAPTISTASSVVMRKRKPGFLILRVVFANRPPLSLR